jgi:rhodanese-related sulfurtransferase
MSETTYTLPRISPQDLSRKEAGSTFLLDVRSPFEYESEHLPESVNVPLDELPARAEEFRSKKGLTVICRSGKRAERAAHELAGKGITATIMDGGLLAWRQSGLPVIEGKKRLSIERQVQLTVGLGLLTGVTLGVLVNPWFLIIPAFFGAGLTFAGLTGTCGLAVLLMNAPWNKLTISCSKHTCQ